jgi:hypothetical protein
MPNEPESIGELFHQIPEAASARVRKRLSALELIERVSMRNTAFESHQQALVERGGKSTPAFWDGVRLHQGEDEVMRAIDAIASRLGLPTQSTSKP